LEKWFKASVKDDKSRVNGEVYATYCERFEQKCFYYSTEKMGKKII
jgi:hypothetical protein